MFLWFIPLSSPISPRVTCLAACCPCHLSEWCPKNIPGFVFPAWILWSLLTQLSKVPDHSLLLVHSAHSLPVYDLTTCCWTRFQPLEHSPPCPPACIAFSAVKKERRGRTSHFPHSIAQQLTR